MEISLAEKAVIAKNDSNERRKRVSVLRNEHVKVQAMINQARSASPENAELVRHWEGAIDFWKRELVLSMQSRSGQGKSPQINIASQEFLAFVLGDLIKGKLSELASLVSGSGGISTDDRFGQLAALNSRLGVINAELAELGESTKMGPLG